MTHAPDQGPPVIVRVLRGGVVESVHRGHVVVADAEGRVHAVVGAVCRDTYLRSAAKPFQAAAVLDLLDQHHVTVPGPGVAIACASHTGTDDHLIEAAHLLALAGLDESALRCPPALPSDTAALCQATAAAPLAHNCSGKHAAFLLAHSAAGHDPAGYLEPASALQARVRDRMAAVLGATLDGPGVDGCGAPAWRAPLGAVAVGFARLAAGHDATLARIRDAMRAHPLLVGGAGTIDARLMDAAPVVAKRGAEGVLGVGLCDPGRDPLGIAVKVDDGAERATGPVAAAVLEALGSRVPAGVAAPGVRGGGRVVGVVQAAPDVAEAVVGAFGHRSR